MSLAGSCRNFSCLAELLARLEEPSANKNNLSKSVANGAPNVYSYRGKS